MTTSMHRLQISLPQWQVQFLSERARRERLSIAEVIRQLVQREAEIIPDQTDQDGLWKLAGIFADHGPLIGGIPVSERPDLYVAEAIAPYVTAEKHDLRSPTEE